MTSELDKKSEQLKREIDSLERIIIPKEKADKQKIATTIKEHWQYLSNKERLEFLNNFVEEIVVINRDKDKKSGKPEIISVKFYEE